MPIGGLCPSCGYADIMFPNTVPQSIADFEARRLESHRNIADRLKRDPLGRRPPYDACHKRSYGRSIDIPY